MTRLPFSRFYILTFLILIMLPGSVLMADEGKSLYLQHCAACHGDDGYGGVGVPLALPAFQSGVSDDYLARTIRVGRPGRVMPAFSRLSDTEVSSIVKFIRGWSTSTPVKHSDTPVSGNAANGKKLFAENCAACHGENGEGGSGTGVTFSRPRDLPIIAPALNNQGFLHAVSDSIIKKTLMEGREGTPMMSFLKKGLNEAQINDIVAYVRSFATQKRPQHKDVSNEPAVLVAESDANIESVLENVKQAVVGANFRLIRVQYLEDGLVKQGEESKKKIIVYFCNFDFLYHALEIDPRIGIFLPCRVTLVEREGKTRIFAVNPRKMSTMFNNEKLDVACDKMTKIYKTILEESTL